MEEDINYNMISTRLKRNFAYLSDVKSSSRGITGVPTGFRKLDAITAGFQPGELTVLTGSTTSGKSSFVRSIINYACEQAFNVALITLESTAEAFTLALLSQESEIPLHQIRNSTINTDEYIELTNTAARLTHYEIHIIDRFYLKNKPGEYYMGQDAPKFTFDTMQQAIYEACEKYNVRLICIDSLPFIEVEGMLSIFDKYAYLGRRLKELAMEINRPILVTATCSSKADSRMDKRPTLADIKQYGFLDSYADLVIGLYRDVVCNPEAENPTLAELTILKNRFGPSGFTVFLNFAREICKFQDLSYE